MANARLQECLSLLRQADDILMDQHEIALAAHLSLVIEILAEKLTVS